MNRLNLSICLGVKNSENVRLTRAQGSQIRCTDAPTRSFDFGAILYNGDAQLDLFRVFLRVVVRKYVT